MGPSVAARGWEGDPILYCNTRDCRVYVEQYFYLVALYSNMKKYHFLHFNEQYAHVSQNVSSTNN
jgi:hypothetical protein